MDVTVDQSGKIEHTHSLTVVAYANGNAKSLMISAIEKRKLLTIMRARFPQTNIYL